MKRFKLLLVAASLCAFALAASPAVAVFPVPDGSMALRMYQGWYDGNPAWYLATDTNDIRWASTQGLTLARKLTSAGVGTGAAWAYVVTNPALNQGPVFETMPGLAAYSGIWRVRAVTWNAGYARVPLTSATDILARQVGGELTVADAFTRVDYPIVALGPLGGPWLAKPYPPFYRIPQGITHNPYAKTITLPYWNVFCDDPTTRRVSVRRVIIPDAQDATLSALLGANLAPGLATFPFTDTQRFWDMIAPKPPSQLPVIEDCPSSLSWYNRNANYSPVMRYTTLNRNIPPYAVINNGTLLQVLIGNGGLVVVSETLRINAPVVKGAP